MDLNKATLESLSQLHRQDKRLYSQEQLGTGFGDSGTREKGFGWAVCDHTQGLMRETLDFHCTTVWVGREGAGHGRKRQRGRLGSSQAGAAWV